MRRALADPALPATVSDLEFAHAVLVVGCEPLDDAPIIDLRIRKGVRRNGVKLAVATARPSALDPNASLVLRQEPDDVHEQELLAADASPSRQVAGRDLLHAFRQRLSEEERQLADRRARGQEWPQIAAELGGNAEALRKKLTRALNRVSRDLGLDGPDHE